MFSELFKIAVAVLVNSTGSIVTPWPQDATTLSESYSAGFTTAAEAPYVLPVE